MDETPHEKFLRLMRELTPAELEKFKAIIEALDECAREAQR